MLQFHRLCLCRCRRRCPAPLVLYVAFFLAAAFLVCQTQRLHDEFVQQFVCAFSACRLSYDIDHECQGHRRAVIPVLKPHSRRQCAEHRTGAEHGVHTLFLGHHPYNLIPVASKERLKATSPSVVIPLRLSNARRCSGLRVAKTQTFKYCCDLCRHSLVLLPA